MKLTLELVRAHREQVRHSNECDSECCECYECEHMNVLLALCDEWFKSHTASWEDRSLVSNGLAIGYIRLAGGRYEGLFDGAIKLFPTIELARAWVEKQAGFSGYEVLS